MLVVTALDALTMARMAWERSQPQMTLTGWADMLDGLDEADRGKPVGLVEPAHSPFLEGGLALKTYDGDGANHMRGARRPQKGA